MKSLKFLNKYLFKYRFRLAAGIFFIAISNLFAIYPAQVTRKAIDFASEAADNYQGVTDLTVKSALFKEYSGIFFNFLLLILGAVLLKGLFMFFMRQTIIVMSRLIEYDLKNEIYNHYQELDAGFYKRNNTGDLMARISEDVSQVRMYLGPAIMYSLNLLVLFIMCITAMLSVSVKLTVLVLLPLPVLSVAIYYVSNLINKKSEQVQTQLSSLSTYAQESFSGIRVLKSFAKERLFSSLFQKESEKYQELSMGLVKVDALFQPLILALIGLSTIITIYIGGRQSIAGEITTGNIAEFVMYVNMLTWPVASIGWVTSIIQRAAASQTRINEFLSVVPGIKSNAVFTEVKGKIQFENVSFIYPDSGIKALTDVSFTINAGESLAIIGRTGSGKSTITNLICRLYDPTEGRILINERDLKQVNVRELRANIGYVPQEVFLFSDTIENNISFGLSGNFTHQQVENAAKDAVIDDNIKDFPEGFSTVVGERGITLSGGQKQRLSIARAIIRSPKILIFDDCLSAVDTATEEQILKNLKKIMHNKTSIIISHRVSSVIHADNILVLEEGKIIESGNHQSLLKEKGVYYQLYHKQLLEGEKE